VKGTTKSRKWHLQLWPKMNLHHRHLSIQSHFMTSMAPSKKVWWGTKVQCITNSLTQPCNQGRIWATTTTKCRKQNLQSWAYSIQRSWRNFSPLQFPIFIQLTVPPPLADNKAQDYGTSRSGVAQATVPLLNSESNLTKRLCSKVQIQPSQTFFTLFLKLPGFSTVQLARHVIIKLF
jgi:hypothetical protein